MLLGKGGIWRGASAPRGGYSDVLEEVENMEPVGEWKLLLGESFWLPEVTRKSAA